tara:strand:+ start:4319 stop:4768 length:450 start_codon:yes stop_codon:yes gene_type:complete
MSYYVYWIVSGQSSYIGATVNPTKRLKQHCGVHAGGARRTRGRLWTYKCVLSGFRTWKEALMCEWSFKFHSKRCRGVESRQRALERVMGMERWTSNSPLASDVPLTIEYDPIQYGLPPDVLPAIRNGRRRTKEERVKAGFKRALHGVTY